MMVVVRCPGCRGPSRVDPITLGSAVGCPRCGASFQAVEEAALLVPGPGWIAPIPPAPRHLLAPPGFDPDFDDELDSELEDETDDETSSGSSADREHDPHSEHDGTQPASVVIGLALLPFLVPICWLLAPIVFGQHPAITIAAPLALAVSTSVLCLAVLSTIDWSPTTRVKGVLVLVVLSYLTGFGLYFVKKEMVDRVRRLIGWEPPWVQYDGGGYTVKLPAHPNNLPVAPPMTDVPLACHKAFHRGTLAPYTFVVGAAAAPKAKNPAVGTDAWFDDAVRDLARPGQLVGQSRAVEYRGAIAGRELVIKLPDHLIRIARVFVINNRVYYLAVESANLDPGDEYVHDFFESFQVR